MKALDLRHVDQRAVASSSRGDAIRIRYLQTYGCIIAGSVVFAEVSRAKKLIDQGIAEIAAPEPVCLDKMQRAETTK